MIKKSYSLIEFGNKKHPLYISYIIGIIAWLATYLASFNIKISNLTFTHIVKKKNLKSALRRLSWFLRRSWMRLSLIDDTNFDFTEDLDIDEVILMEVFLDKCQHRMVDAFYQADYLFILSFKAHKEIKCQALSQKTLDLFIEKAQTVYDYLEENKSNIKDTNKTSSSNAIEKSDKANGDKFIKDATSLLSRFSKFIPKEEYPWYVISGTFLGLHRENGFLKHDIDVDIGINANEINIDEFIKKLHEVPNMSVKNNIYMPVINIENNKMHYKEQIAILKLIDISGIQIDVFIHYQKDDKIIHGSKIHTWENSNFKLITRNLVGIDVYCPNNPEQYLSENYGDWETPVIEFSCSTDTPNLTISQNFYSISFFLRQLLSFTKTQNDLNKFKKIERLLIQEKIFIDGKINIPFINVK